MNWEQRIEEADSDIDSWYMKEFFSLNTGAKEKYAAAKNLIKLAKAKWAMRASFEGRTDSVMAPLVSGVYDIIGIQTPSWADVVTDSAKDAVDAAKELAKLPEKAVEAATEVSKASVSIAALGAVVIVVGLYFFRKELSFLASKGM